MMYIEYEYYTNQYRGTLTIDIFNQFLRKACAYIDKVTYCRLKYGAEITDDIKMAVCAAIDILNEQEMARNKVKSTAGIKSESADGYSVSFRNYNDFDKQCEQQLYDAVSVYLSLSHPLRYRGG